MTHSIAIHHSYRNCCQYIMIMVTMATFSNECVFERHLNNSASFSIVVFLKSPPVSHCRLGRHCRFGRHCRQKLALLPTVVIIAVQNLIIILRRHCIGDNDGQCENLPPISSRHGRNWRYVAPGTELAIGCANGENATSLCPFYNPIIYPIKISAV